MKEVIAGATYQTSEEAQPAGRPTERLSSGLVVNLCQSRSSSPWARIGVSSHTSGRRGWPKARQGKAWLECMSMTLAPG